MALFPEREPKLPIEERPVEAEVPPHIERAGVTPIPTQFKAQVKGDDGQNLIQATPTTVFTLQVPKSQATLLSLVKGSVEDSITWFAAFWLRMIKKAIHFGWKILFNTKS